MRQVLHYPVWCSEERIPKETCEEIIKLGKELQTEEAAVYGQESKNLDEKYRKTNVGWFPQGHTLEGLLRSYVSIANMETNWNFTVTSIEQVQFGQYKRKHFYDWHRDTSSNPKLPNRKLSVSVNLSNPKDYEGGNLEFKNYWGTQKLIMSPEQLRLQGTVIVFPSMLFHRVSPVKRGTRYSLVQWYSGPEFT